MEAETELKLKSIIGAGPFAPGSLHTAQITFTNPTQTQWDYQWWLWFKKGERSTYMAGGNVTLAANQSDTVVSPLTMPSEVGTYESYINVNCTTPGFETGFPAFYQEDVLIQAPVLDEWLGLTSANYLDSCGGDTGRCVPDALDGNNAWTHLKKEAHWFILDLGQRYTIKKAKSFSNYTRDPTSVEIYISDALTGWGNPVASGISVWRNTCSYIEVELTTKTGRYVKVVVSDTEHPFQYLMWGGGCSPFKPFFDMYGRLA